MKLSAALRLSDLPRLALAGAGGKTSALFCLGRELLPAHPTVILTTTTHLGAWQVSAGDSHIIINAIQDCDRLAESPPGLIVVSGPLGDARRYRGLTPPALERLLQHADEHGIPLLVEADGARLLPLKAPAEHEPVIPEFVDSVLVCAGLNALDQPLTAEWVHRPEQFARLSGLRPGEAITPEALSRVLAHPQGGLKNIPPAARRVLLLNQADSAHKQAQAHAIAMQVQQAFHSVIIAALSCLPDGAVSGIEQSSPPAQLHAVHASIAGVILAAGGASRYGQPKQLLAWQGQPMVRHVAQIVLQAGLAPVVVVTGAVADQVSAALGGLPVRLVNNPHWQSGQSTSLQAGLSALPPTAGGVVFLLADQPNLSAALVQALVEEHSRTLAPIVAPLVDGQRANPVLFDPITFPDLIQVSGDMGGRQLFSKYPLRYVPWHDRAVLLDVDTPQDYEPPL